jgi:polyferredoxin
LDKKQRKPLNRRLIQVYTALLYNAYIKGFAEGEIYTGVLKNACVPGLNCYSCPGAISACPLGSLQNAISASADRPAFYVIGIILLFGMFLGRVICGFLCPFGLIQELLHKIPVKKLKKNKITQKLTLIKYVILSIFVVVIPLFFGLRKQPLPAFCKYICPAGTLEGALMLMIHPDNADLRSLTGGIFYWKLAVLIAMVISCVFIFRAFCRFICPLGAIYSLFSKIALLGVRVDMNRCNNCGACVKTCQMDIKKVGDRECIQCGECIDVCPEKAITFKAGKLVLRGPDIAHKEAES